jgi:hypothetical protein
VAHRDRHNAEKGDHRHFGAQGLKYRFTDIDTPVADFLRDKEKPA